jgi:hypothetical protein
MDLGAILTWLNGLGLTASESLLAGAVVALAGALVAYARHVEQRDRAERQYQRDEHLAGRTYMQAMIDRLMDELGKHGAAAPTTARTLETFDERLERIERALMERRL